MSNYSKATDFASKDSLASGNPLKVIKGAEIDDEFEALEVAVNTKADINSPTFTGVPAAPTATAGTNTTQLATTAFVTTAVHSILPIGTADISDDAVTGAKIADDAIDSNHYVDGSIDTAHLADDSVTSAKIAENAVDATALNISGNGTAGQMLVSDGDGSFSWASGGSAVTMPDTVVATSSTSGAYSTTATYTATQAGWHVMAVNVWQESGVSTTTRSFSFPSCTGYLSGSTLGVNNYNDTPSGFKVSIAASSSAITSYNAQSGGDLAVGAYLEVGESISFTAAAGSGTFHNFYRVWRG